MKHIMPTMNKGLRKLIHKKYDTLTINEYYTSQKCCECYNDLKHCKDKKGKEIYRLFQCSNCVSSKSKNTVFRTRDKNSAISSSSRLTGRVYYLLSFTFPGYVLAECDTDRIILTGYGTLQFFILQSPNQTEIIQLCAFLHCCLVFSCW